MEERKPWKEKDEKRKRKEEVKEGKTTERKAR